MNVATLPIFCTSAFWWIAGDCLGFRRNTGLSKKGGGSPYQFTHSLRYDQDRIVPYAEQTRILVRHGFCLWDVVQSCHRPGSLDQDISQEEPNPIREFCNAVQNHNLQRIVLANGGTGAKFFIRHFTDWLASGELRAGKNLESQKIFGKAIATAQKKKYGTSDDTLPTQSINRTITLIAAMSVSPAAAKYSYEEKRDFWEKHVYTPGLNDFGRLKEK